MERPHVSEIDTARRGSPVGRRDEPTFRHGNPAKARPMDTRPIARGTPGEVFWAFLKLGLTSFGGPIAHLGYLRDECVVCRRCIDE
jgi:hypothetical protein